MSKPDRAWSAASWAVGFAVFVGVTALSQWLAVTVYQAWWDSTDAAGQPIPAETLTFLQWGIGVGAGYLAGKAAGDRV